MVNTLLSLPDLAKPINRLLAALPGEDYQRILPYLESVELHSLQTWLDTYRF